MTSRKFEDFDEYCDPKNPTPLKFEGIKTAAIALQPFIRPMPLVTSHASKHFKTHIFYKLECMHTTGSFKERGAVNVLQRLPLDQKKIGVIIASLGNEAIAMSHYCNQWRIPLVAIMPNSVPVSHQQRCQGPGIKVIVHGANLFESMKYARSMARDKSLTYINGRDHPDILTGYATIAMEIIKEYPATQAIMIPVGTGGLAAAIGYVIKREKPHILIYGVQPEATPLFYKTLESDDILPPIVVNEDTFADSIAVTSLGVNSMAMVKPFIDKMLLVKEVWIAQAMLHMYEKQRIIVEGAAACPLAAVIGGLVPELKMKNVVMIVTGGNVSPLILSRCLERGLSAEGRLVRFRVMIKDNGIEYKQLLKLLADGEYGLQNHFESHRWFDGEEYKAEISLCCRTDNLEHAVEMKRIVEKAFPQNVMFDTAPFNDKRLCPCYVFKKNCNKL